MRIAGKKSSIGGVLIVISIFVAAAAGWIMNVVRLYSIATVAGWDGHEIEFILRGVGVFVPPLGAIGGYL